MQKIIPHLWFDKEAKEAASFYTSIFPESKVNHTTVLHDTPSGDCDVVTFEIWNHTFMAISAGPEFQPSPSISFIVNFDPLSFGSAPDPAKAAREKLDTVWNELAVGGTALMPLDEYPFSKRYGWIKDKYGFTWQLMLSKPEGERRPPIVPSLMFKGSNYGKAEEAINFYLSVFKNSRLGGIHRYPKGMEPDKEGNIMFADYMLENTWFAIMESAHKHNFDFNEAISLMVQCKDQSEIDYYWQKLSAVPASEQCGWLRDKYGVSWQITSAEMYQMLKNGTREQIDRVTQTFLEMKKINVAKIKEAYDGKAKEAIQAH